MSTRNVSGVIETNEKLIRRDETRLPKLKKWLNKYKISYIFISPFFILYAIFGLYPVFYSVYLSLFQARGRKDWTFVGLDNYRRLLFEDPVFPVTLLNMGKYLLFIVIPMTFFGLVLAVLLNSKQAQRLGGFYRTMLILPYVLAPTVISVIFVQIYDYSFGWVNLLLGAVGLNHIDWLGTEQWSLIGISLVLLWQFVGYNALIALAALTGISPEIYDAARVDGCNVFQEFGLITLPLMRPILLFMAVMTTIGVFNMFAQPWLLTHGGPGYSSNTLIILLYRTAFEIMQFGYAAAIGVTIFILTAIFSFLQITFNRGFSSE
ncbi:MAG: sugar ABC transporter permease [Anaerolineales bacterium]|nr:sugar ABC transporter permease [Anaerolineales bacterium]